MKIEINTNKEEAIVINQFINVVKIFDHGTDNKNIFMDVSNYKHADGSILTKINLNDIYIKKSFGMLSKFAPKLFIKIQDIISFVRETKALFKNTEEEIVKEITDNNLNNKDNFISNSNTNDYKIAA